MVIPLEGDDSDALDVQAVDTPFDTSYYTSTDFVTRYQDGSLTPIQVAKRLLELIEQPRHKAAINQVVPSLVLEAAEASAKRYATGKTLGPLDGVPVVIKDELDIHGYETTMGSARVSCKGEGETSWCVKKLEEAGAIVIAKSAMHECGSDVRK